MIIVLGMLVYSFFFQQDTLDNLEVSGDSVSSLGADLVNLSQDLSRANLNPQLFTDPGYKNLEDFSAAVTPQPLGRPNPFDPLGK